MSWYKPWTWGANPRPQASTLTGQQLADLLSFGSMTASGRSVNAETAKKAAAYFACVRLLAGAVAGLPCPVYIDTDKGREKDKKHPAYKLLNIEPCPTISSAVFWETVVSHVHGHGNAYSWIERNYGGAPQALWLLDPRSASPERQANGRIHYTVRMLDGTFRVFDQDDILHFPNIFFDLSGVKGMSTVSAGAESIGLSLAAEEFTGRQFSNGIHSDLVAETDATFDAEQAKFLRDLIQKKNAGLANAGLPLVGMGGVKFKALGISPEDAQLIESRSFQVTDIARIFGVPPHMIGEVSKTTSWGKGIEGQGIDFVTYTLKPMLIRIEQELNRKLIRSTKHFVEFNVSGLLRGDIKTRHESYNLARGGNQAPGYMSINEIRAKENLPAVPGGDDLYVPLTGKEEQNSAQE